MKRPSTGAAARCCRRLALLAALLAGVPALADFVPGDVTLTIGPEWTVAREVRTIAFTNEEQDVVLELPLEAELSTLSLSSERGSVQLVRWERLARSATPSAVRLVPGPKGYRVLPDASGTQQPPATERVRCRLSTTYPRTRDVAIQYQLHGLGWRAQYELAIRGDIANFLEQLSLDLDGRVIISNSTLRTFRRARVTLVGENAAPPAREYASTHAPGILMLNNDSPLSDLWLPGRAPRGVSYAYRLPGRIDIAAVSETSAELVVAHRKPADRLYAMDSEKFSLDAPGPWHPLTRYLAMRNDLGRALPPGPALIYLGTVRGALYQQAWLRHTPPDAEIRIDLGIAEGVTGARRSLGRGISAAGFNEESVEIQLANALPSAIHVEVMERPPVPLAWDVTRSSRPYDLVEHKLHYSVQMDARSESQFSYTVRVTEPEM